MELCNRKNHLASESTPVSEPVVEPVKAAAPVQSTRAAASEEVLTAEDLETIAIKKAEAKAAKRQADADAKKEGRGRDCSQSIGRRKSKSGCRS